MTFFLITYTFIFILIMSKKSFLLLFSFVLLSSCYEDEQAVDYDYLNGQTLVFVPTLGENVNYVVYTWDDAEIAKETEMPFILRYQLTNQTPGSHTLTYHVVSTKVIDGATVTSTFLSSKTFIIK